MKKIIDFMEENVDGRTLFTKELVYELENGALQGIYSDQISFSNLKYSQSGFQIDMFIVSNEKIWLIDKEGQRDKLRKDFSSVSMFRFELAMRKSTNAITGCFRFISASGKNVPAEAVVSGIYDVRLENSVPGELFEKGTYFLPQLIASAEAMEKAIDYLEPYLAKERGDQKLDTIVMATVKGDIHDI